MIKREVKMKRRTNRYLCLIAVSIFFVFVGLADAMVAQTAPTLNKGKKWRIGYLEGGPYVNYQGSLKSTVQSLMTLGWIEKADIPKFSNLEDTNDLWAWLSNTARSQYLEFVKDGYWSSEWKKDKRAHDAAQIKKRMNTARDIDLFIAMGTWAGQDLVPIFDKIPVIVMSCSDLVKAKIVKSEKDSGKDNVHAWCDPTRGERRLRLFHDILGFKRLGIIYEDSKEGRLYADLSSIRKISKERNFRVIECTAPDIGLTLQECKDNVSVCLNKVGAQIDSFAISDHRGLHSKFFPEIIDPLFKNGVPAFTSVRGPTLVRRGVLMGIAREDYQPLGNFYAGAITGVFNGSKPRDLTQIYKEPLKLAINLETAEVIGYDIPPNVRKIADILYEKIDRTPLD
jgi:ABC-type uncharacterized transport system substrate-binding protein